MPQHLAAALCLCGVKTFTTKAQRTQRKHRDFSSGRENVHDAAEIVSCASDTFRAGRCAPVSDEVEF
jgi:hypothetical protein